MTTQTRTKWAVKGDVISACNCDWGCPCNFNAPPTFGGCDGFYAFHINQGNLGDAKLDGLTVGFALRTPKAIHLGNMTVLLTVDEKATPQQREAIGTIFGGKVGGPFGAFAPLIVKLIGPEFVPVQWKLDGARSEVRMGNRVEVRLDTVKNPATAKPATYTLKFNEGGLLTDQSELYTSSTFKVSHPELSFAHPGKYGQTFKFNYGG
ncbi:MAG: DUF1326 domain-containing protein [Chloroflexi bacterium]|nr:DUF1326 domain-containing protein [Chloroflexota bacterium]